MIIDTNNLVENLLGKGLGIANYKKIMESMKNVDVSSNEPFQKTFNYFYKVRRNAEWRKTYYTLFESVKNNASIRFKEIVTELYERTSPKSIEMSFSSKMLATINPDMPIFDELVLDKLGLRLNGTKRQRLDNAIVLYDDIIAWYDNFLTTDNAKESIRIFDTTMPHFQWLSDSKKIDYLIWGIREQNIWEY